MQLFREEVLQARTASFLGATRIGRPPTFAAIALGALLLGTLLVAFAAWGHVTRKATLPGVLVPEQGVLHIGARGQAAWLTCTLRKAGTSPKASACSCWTST